MSVNSSIKRVNLTPYVRYFQSYNNMSVAAVQQLKDEQWQKPAQESNTLNFGYNEANFWVKFSLTNSEDKDLIRFLETAYPVLDHVDIYVFEKNNLINSWKLGDKLPFNSRPIRHHHFVVPLNIPSGTKLDFYIRVNTTSSVQIPLILWDEVDLLEKTSTTVLSLGLYYGTMMVMVLYNLFVFFSVRESTYLYYVFFVASIGLFLASINGISYQYLWPNELWWNDQSIVICLTCALIFGALFTLNFLKLEQNKPQWARGFKLGIGFFVVLFIAGLLFPYSIMIRSVIFTAVITIFIAIPVGIIRWHEGDSSAKYYTVAWFTLLFGGVILALNKFNLLPRNGLTENATQLGSALEVILLSLALADRLNTEKRARYEAQQKSLENERLLRLAQAETLSQEQEARIANEKALASEIQAR
ncbi:MAG: diguanylate cyclase, partial [Pseudomonadales bacterium]|nr:diguanylate cyclase [Pseudomonadales bacterium]